MAFQGALRLWLGSLPICQPFSVGKNTHSVKKYTHSKNNKQELSKPMLATSLHVDVLVTYLLSYLGTYLFTRLLTRYILQPLLYKLSKIVLI